MGEFLQCVPRGGTPPLIAPIGLAGGRRRLGRIGRNSTRGRAPYPQRVPAAAPQSSALPVATSTPVAIGAPGAPTAAPTGGSAGFPGRIGRDLGGRRDRRRPLSRHFIVPPYAVGPPGIGVGFGHGQ